MQRTKTILSMIAWNQRRHRLPGAASLTAVLICGRSSGAALRLLEAGSSMRVVAVFPLPMRLRRSGRVARSQFPEKQFSLVTFFVADQSGLSFVLGLGVPWFAWQCFFCPYNFGDPQW